MPRELLGDLIIGLDHVGVAVKDLERPIWRELLGLPYAHREQVDAQRTEAAFLDPPEGPATLELICPLPGNEGVAKFLEKRGEGLHHVAFAVRDLGQALARLAEAGVELIDRAPRPGARGHLVAFLHPRATGGTLVELVERH